jgi:hypothetical protein
MTPVPPVAAVERALVEAAGNVTAAARTLRIASANLRGYVRAHPLLADVVFEQIEQEIDAAQQVLLDGLRSDNATTRIPSGGLHPATHRGWAASRLGKRRASPETAKGR